MFILFLLVAFLVGAIALCLVRAMRDEEGEVLALIGAIALFGSGVGLLARASAAYAPSLQDYCNEHLPWWLGTVALGTVLGLVVYVGWHSLHLTRAAYLWACRRPDEDETLGFTVRRHLWTIVGVALVFVMIKTVDISAAATSSGRDAFDWLVILIVVSSLPMYQTWVLPWLLYYRARKLDATNHGTEIRHWLEEIRKTHDVPKFHLRVQEGKMVNALALGGMGRYFIVLGRGLLEHLSTEHVKAVLAHEIGHVLNRDTTRRATPLILLSACIHLLYFQHVVLRMDSLWKEALLVAVGVPFFWVVLPGIFQRRWEYHADRKAVELMGDAKPVAQSLVRIYDVNDVHIDAPGWPHPSLRARLKAIGSLDANGNTNPTEQP